MLHWDNRYGVAYPPFSLLLLISVVPPVGGLPGGLDEHASQGAASATCRQHAVMSQQSRSSTRAVNQTSQKCWQYLDKAPRLLLFRPCWKRPLVIWLWKLLSNYTSNIYISICIYLLALRCLCGGFHGSMPPQNHVGSSMIILFIWN